MSDDKVDSVRSSSAGVIGRARNEARGHAVFFDSSAKPQPDALTNSEAFLGAVSSCGVTLIEGYAKEKGVPLQHSVVTIHGVRQAAEQNRFASVTMSFELSGVSQAEAESLVAVYTSR